jgi:hypothetical protein
MFPLSSLGEEGIPNPGASVIGHTYDSNENYVREIEKAGEIRQRDIFLEPSIADSLTDPLHQSLPFRAELPRHLHVFVQKWREGKQSFNYLNSVNWRLEFLTGSSPSFILLKLISESRLLKLQRCIRMYILITEAWRALCEAF